MLGNKVKQLKWHISHYFILYIKLFNGVQIEVLEYQGMTDWALINDNQFIGLLNKQRNHSKPFRSVFGFPSSIFLNDVANRTHFLRNIPLGQKYFLFIFRNTKISYKWNKVLFPKIKKNKCRKSLKMSSLSPSSLFTEKIEVESKKSL